MVKSRLKKVPQSARLSAGGGCKCYLGNAHMGVETSWKGLPLLERSLFSPIEKFFTLSPQTKILFSQALQIR